MIEITWKERVRYWFDNYMSGGTIALIGGLAGLSLVLILISAVVLVATGASPDGESPLGFWEAAWASLMRTLDAGTMGGDTGWGFRLIMFAVTLGGVFVISSLIGVLTSGLETKMDELRKGRSRVIELNHTVILGWSSQIFSIISELVIANSNQKSSCIVILAEKDKLEMEDEIRDMVGETGKTRIVCRTGSPINMSDLEIASLQTARAIIVLSPGEDSPDAEVIKTILAITNNPKRRKEPYHIVAEIRDPKNLDVAKIVGKQEVELVLVGNLISRVIAQTCRQSGLSVVYTELLDFGGDEIYFKEIPALNGQTFGDAILSFEDSALIGFFRPGSGVQLNPAMDERLQAGDQVILIAEDDDKINLAGHAVPPIQDMLIQLQPASAPWPEKTILLGWNWRAPSIVKELDNYVAPGSEVTIVADVEVETMSQACSALDLVNQQPHFIPGDTTDRRVLDGLQLHLFNHIIVLSYSDNLGVQEADARTLVTLLHLRDISERTGSGLPIVTEMLDLRNRELAEVTRADDFIVSDKLISLMLSQISENKALNAVFADIFDPEGSEIYLKPIGNYVTLDRPVNFYTLAEAARRRNEVAFGYRRAVVRHQDAQGDQDHGVVVNPDKSQEISFVEGDRLIVLAED